MKAADSAFKIGGSGEIRTLVLRFKRPMIWPLIYEPELERDRQVNALGSRTVPQKVVVPENFEISTHAV